MATVGEIYCFLDQKAPFYMQLGFDNAGFLVGREGSTVEKILVALDITQDVIEEAIEKQVNLIVAHHPIIWEKRTAITDQDPAGKRLLSLIENGISAICAHTNLDAVEGGVNTELARLCKLKNPIPLHEDGVDEKGIPFGIGRVGDRLDGPTTLQDFISEVKAALQINCVRVSNAGSPVHRIAVGGGSCGSMLSDVIRQGCDTFLTADVKLDQYIEAKAQGINLLDAGHYSTETIICPVIVAWLREAFPQLPIFISERQMEAFSYC